MRFVVALFVLACSCFDPGSAPLICSEAKPGCPEGLTCLGGFCRDSGDKTDMSETDLVGQDLSSIDMSEIPGCADGNGIRIGNQGCWGCRGVFGGTGRKASALCSATHKLATTSAKITDSECLSVLGGFYLSDVWGGVKLRDKDTTFSQCGSLTLGNQLGFFGCGIEDGSGILDAPAACGGFRPVMVCYTTNGIYCPSLMLDGTQNSKPNNGVLCCPK